MKRLLTIVLLIISALPGLSQIRPPGGGGGGPTNGVTEAQATSIANARAAVAVAPAFQLLTNVSLVGLGDSMIDDGGIPGVGGTIFTYLFYGTNYAGVGRVNQAVSGDRLTNFLAQYETKVRPFTHGADEYDRKIVLDALGRNDLNSGVTGSDLITAKSNLWTKLICEDGCDVLALTIMSTNVSAVEQAVVDAWMLDQPSNAVWQGRVSVLDPIGDVPGYATYDGTHPTVGWSTNVAQYIKTNYPIHGVKIRAYTGTVYARSTRPGGGISLHIHEAESIALQRGSRIIFYDQDGLGSYIDAGYTNGHYQMRMWNAQGGSHLFSNLGISSQGFRLDDGTISITPAGAGFNRTVYLEGQDGVSKSVIFRDGGDVMARLTVATNDPSEVGFEKGSLWVHSNGDDSQLYIRDKDDEGGWTALAKVGSGGGVTGVTIVPTNGPSSGSVSGATMTLNIQTNAPSYVSISVAANQASVTDGQTIYFALPGFAPNTSVTTRRQVVVPVSGTIVAGVINLGMDPVGSNEAWPFYVRVNDATDYLIDTVDASVDMAALGSGLSIPVTAGDSIHIKAVNPTWATNPTNPNFFGHLVIQTSP